MNSRRFHGLILRAVLYRGKVLGQSECLLIKGRRRGFERAVHRNPSLCFCGRPGKSHRGGRHRPCNAPRRFIPPPNRIFSFNVFPENPSSHIYPFTAAPNNASGIPHGSRFWLEKSDGNMISTPGNRWFPKRSHCGHPPRPPGRLTGAYQIPIRHSHRPASEGRRDARKIPTKE